MDWVRAFGLALALSMCLGGKGNEGGLARLHPRRKTAQVETKRNARSTGAQIREWDPEMEFPVMGRAVEADGQLPAVLKGA